MNVKKIVPKFSFLCSILIYLALMISAYILAFSLRLSFKIDTVYWHIIIKTLPLLICIKMAIFGYYGFFSDQWSYPNMDYIWKILKAHVLAMVSFITGVVFIYTVTGFPRSIFVLDCIFSFCLVSAMHCAAKLFKGGFCLKREQISSILLYLGVAVFLFYVAYSSVIARYSLLFIYFAYFIRYASLTRRPFFKGFRLNTPLNKGFLLFFISAIISTVFSMNPYHSQKILFNRYLLYLLFFYVGYNFIRTRNEKRIFELFFFLSGIILGMGGLVFYFHHFPERLFFSWNINVDIGTFAVLFLPFSFFYVRFEKETILLRTCAGLSFCLLAACLLLNFSRGMFVSVVLGISSVLFLKRDKKGFVFMFIFICVFLVSAYLLKNTRLINLNTWDFRIPNIKEGLKHFKLSPLFGRGLGSFELLNFYCYGVPNKILHVENLVIEILAQSGIIGLIAFFYLFWLYSKRIILSLNNLKTYQFALAGSIFSLLIGGLFASVILVGVFVSFLFWFLLGISLSNMDEIK